MKVKRFFASDMRAAIRLVRESQGPDAVILSNRSVDGGIEIISALDFDPSLFEEESNNSSSTSKSDIADETYSPKENVPVAPIERPSAASRVNWSQDPAIVSMSQEIKQLRGLLENQLAHLAWGDMTHRQPIETELLRRLDRLDLDADLNRKISAACANTTDEEHAWQIALSELTTMLPVSGEDPLEQGGIFALVGSTGVGKTTSIAKLAARYALRHGQRHIALVSTDTYRIGAHEQLMTYGRLMGISVQSASNHKELKSILNSLADKRLILIDTAGMSQRDVRLTEQFSTLNKSDIPIRTLLVLSATSHRSVIGETIRAFENMSPDGAILTKLDEAASLGGVLSAVIKNHCPLIYTTDGQRVPEDLSIARADSLIQLAADFSNEQLLPDETLLAERFGGFRANVGV